METAFLPGRVCIECMFLVCGRGLGKPFPCRQRLFLLNNFQAFSFTRVFGRKAERKEMVPGADVRVLWEHSAAWMVTPCHPWCGCGSLQIRLFDVCVIQVFQRRGLRTKLFQVTLTVAAFFI